MLLHALQTIYPNRCLACGDDVLSEATLCASCWQQTHFITGQGCTSCGAPVTAAPGASPAICETCHAHPPAWSSGRAVARYDGPARRMAMALKHGDRHDLVPPIAAWMARAARDVIDENTLLAPVPLHWTRLLRRRFNQAALLTAELARLTGARQTPDLLQRRIATPPQQNMTRDDRFENLRGAIRAHTRHAGGISGQHIVLVDDVMTTGATLNACTEACLAAGAARVDVVVFARVARAE